MTDFDKSKIENGILEMKNPKAIFAVFYEECMIIGLIFVLYDKYLLYLTKATKVGTLFACRKPVSKAPRETGADI